MSKTAAMILAGGKGTRMDVLCQLRPKPILPFGARHRVIDFSLTNCVRSEIADIGVLVDYRRESLRDYLCQWHAANKGARLNILPPLAASYTGTADAVYQNLDFVEKQEADTVLVLAADHVYKMDYRKLIDFHRASGADATIAVVRMQDEAHRFGTVTTGVEGRITDFIEKSSAAKSGLVSMGIYVFNREALARRLKEDAADPRSVHDFGYAVMPRMVKNDRVYAYEHHGFWQDIGTTESYYLASMELLTDTPRFSLDGGWDILGEGQQHGQEAGGEADIVKSVIGPGCYIRGRVINSILSPGVHVAEHAIVRDSILMANSVVGYHSVVERCIVDEGAKIGKFCYVGFSAGVPSSQNITVLGKSVTVPDCTAIGRSVKVMQGVGPASFDTSVVSSGTILTHPR